MRVLSFYEEAGQLRPLEVNLQLWPGAPEWIFTGGADNALKDVVYRIKSALKSAGFEVLAHKQVVVSLKPYYEKKFSRGADLALALAYLLETQQIPITWGSELTSALVFGQVDLDGQVRVPPVHPVWLKPDLLWITGESPQGPCYKGRILRIPHLSALRQPPSPQEQDWPSDLTFGPDPAILELKISPDWIPFLATSALGELSVLLAGVSGAGKTTAARVLHALRPPLTEAETAQIMERLLAENCAPEKHIWRPFVAPHHTIPIHSLIGGGTKPNGGELARAHLGTLLLDEFFEFEPSTQEALREPLEQKQWRIARGQWQRIFPFEAQVVATCNLCPCGAWVVGMEIPSCRYSWKKCRSYQSRLSGPLLDRFDVIFWVRTPLKPIQGGLTVGELRQELEARRTHPYPTWEFTAEKFMYENPLWPALSTRRQQAWKKTAEALARWKGLSNVDASCVIQAYDWAVDPFWRIQDPQTWTSGKTL